MPGSLCDVLPSAAALLGVPGAEDRLGLTERVGEVRRVVVLLVDGLGYHLLPQLVDDAPLLASVLAGTAGHLDELSCTFPSTTPTSLASFATGVEPGQHGVLGFTVNIPGTDRVLTHIFWHPDNPGDPAPAIWQPVPTWFERTRDAGIATRAVLPGLFVGSGLSEAVYRGATIHPTAKGDYYAGRVAAEVAAGPGLVYAYTAALDKAAHAAGVDSPWWHAAAARVDALLRHLLEQLPDDAALLVTADHGGLNVPAASRIDVDADPRLSAGVRVVAGEARVRYLHTEPGAADDVAAAWTELLAGRAEVQTRDQAVAAGLFGKVRDEHLARIGDVVVTCTGDNAVIASRREPPEAAKLVGFHGGLTDVETAIPLIVFRG